MNKDGFNQSMSAETDCKLCNNTLLVEEISSSAKLRAAT